MSGMDIIGALLAAGEALTERVPEGQMRAGRLPAGVPLPALLVRSVSLTDVQPLKGGPIRSIERVSATVRAGSYQEQCELIALVRAACAGFVGDVAGHRNVSVLTAGLGPDVNGPGDSFEQAQDFRVSFDAQ